jgi:hypothetical protein
MTPAGNEAENEDQTSSRVRHLGLRNSYGPICTHPAKRRNLIHSASVSVPSCVYVLNTGTQDPSSILTVSRVCGRSALGSGSGGVLPGSGSRTGAGTRRRSGWPGVILSALSFQGWGRSNEGGGVSPPFFRALLSGGVRCGGARRWHCNGRAKT